MQLERERQYHANRRASSARIWGMISDLGHQNRCNARAWAFAPCHVQSADDTSLTYGTAMPD